MQSLSDDSKHSPLSWAPNLPQLGTMPLHSNSTQPKLKSNILSPPTPLAPPSLLSILAYRIVIYPHSLRLKFKSHLGLLNLNTSVSPQIHFLAVFPLPFQSHCHCHVSIPYFFLGQLQCSSNFSLCLRYLYF